jgi:hypothetical protein
MSRLRCAKHGEQAYVLNIVVTFMPDQPIPQVPALCYLCFLDAMVRLGVCAMYPAEVIEKVEEWPESLEEKKS